MQSEPLQTKRETPAAGTGAEPARIAAFMRKASYELTHPTAGDLDDMRRIVGPGVKIYLTAVPTRPLDELLSAASRTQERELVPVPHVAARSFLSFSALGKFVEALVREAGVDEVMLVGGDGPASHGGIADALSVLQSGALEAAGVRAVGLAGFPDGHPFLSDEELELALVTKIAAAQGAGLEAHLVTQFCFDVRPIETWLAWLRQRGIHAPVRVGFAGPTSLMTWLKFAHRCGVRASAEALVSRSGLARHAFKSVAPDPLVRSIAAAAEGGRWGTVEPHFFAFGSPAATARWAAPLAKGRLTFNGEGGFDPIPEGD